MSGTPYSAVRSKEPGRPGQLDHVLRVLDGLEAPAAVLGLDEARDVLLGHALAEALGDQVDELLAAQDPLGVARIHHRLVGPRQAQTRAADDHRAGGRPIAVVGAAGQRG